MTTLGRDTSAEPDERPERPAGPERADPADLSSPATADVAGDAPADEFAFRVPAVVAEPAGPRGGRRASVAWAGASLAARAGRVAQLWSRVSWGYRVAGAVFVVARVAVAITVHTSFIQWDSQEYRPTGQPVSYPFVNLLGHALRAWPVPLFYSMFPNDTFRTQAQVLISIFAWLVLAVTVALALRQRVLRAVAFGTVLAFGTTTYVTNWDFEILSESLTISTAILCLAAWIRFTRRPAAWPGAAVVITTTLFLFMRPQLLPLVVLLAVAMFVWARQPEGDYAKIVVGGALAVGALWGHVVATNVEATSATRPEAVGDFTQNFVTVLQYRIMTDPESYQWFKDHGMPEPLPPGPDNGPPGSPNRYSKDRALMDWITSSGETALVEFSLARPDKFPLQFEAEASGLFLPKRGEATYANVPTVLPQPLQWLIAPTEADPPRWAR
jgi:hypothetical protein